MTIQLTGLPVTTVVPSTAVFLVKFAGSDTFDYQVTKDDLLNGVLQDSDLQAVVGKAFKLIAASGGGPALPVMSGENLTGVTPATGDASVNGVVKLSDSTSSVSSVVSGIAATPLAVRTVEVAKFNKSGGTISGNVTLDTGYTVRLPNTSGLTVKNLAGTNRLIVSLTSGNDVYVGTTTEPTILRGSSYPKIRSGTGTIYDILHTGNVGSGSNIDANALRGITGEKFVRNDVAQAMAGALTISADSSVSRNTTGAVEFSAINTNAAGSGELHARNTTDGGVALVGSGTGAATISQTSGAGVLEDVYIAMARNGAVGIRYNNSTKIATTNTGIAVTGNIIMSGSTLQSGGSTTAGLYVTSSVLRYKNSDILTVANVDGLNIEAATLEGGVGVGSLMRSDANDSWSSSWTGSGTINNTGYLRTTSYMRAGNWFESTGSTGWKNTSYGGGMYMIDSTYIRTSGSKKFYVNNEILASGNIIAGFSDKRLKQDFKKLDLDESIEVINSLKPGTYKANAKGRATGMDPGEQVGFYTQDIEKYRPQAVTLAAFDRDKDGKSISGKDYKTADYARLIPDIVNVLQAVRVELAEANAKIAKLEGA